MDKAFSLVANSGGPKRVVRNKGKGYVDKCDIFTMSRPQRGRETATLRYTEEDNFEERGSWRQLAYTSQETKPRNKVVK